MYQAKEYSDFNGSQKSDATYLFDNYLHLVKWRENDEILDIGCASGDVTTEYLLPRIPENYGSLLGVDLQEVLVNFAKANHRSDQRIDFRQLNIADQELPKDLLEKFDHIFSCNCVHWVQDQRQVFENMYKLLKPGGDVLMLFMHQHPIYDFYGRISKMFEWKEYLYNVGDFLLPYRHFASPLDELGMLLKNAGFEIGVCQIDERTHTYQSIDIYLNSMMVANPFYRQIPQDLKEQYKQAYVTNAWENNLIKLETNGDPVVINNYRVFIVFATKKK